MILLVIIECFSAQVVKLVDTLDLGSSASRHVGSSPILGISMLFLYRHVIKFPSVVK